MLKWIILIAVVGIPLFVLYIYDFQSNTHTGDVDMSKSSILNVGREFVNQVSPEETTRENTLGVLLEITDKDILKEKEIPDLSASENIQNNGVRLSASYNQASYDYSTGKTPVDEYFLKLLDFKIKYEKYMTAIDSYIGNDDIIIQKNSMKQELEEINQQINTLKRSENFEDGWETKSEFDKYKKLLPSMFTP